MTTFRFLLIAFFSMPFLSMAQIPSPTTEQQLEAATEGNDDIVTDDDSFLQQLQLFATDPINLNTADATLLKELSGVITYANTELNFIPECVWQFY